MIKNSNSWQSILTVTDQEEPDSFGLNVSLRLAAAGIGNFGSILPG